MPAVHLLTGLPDQFLGSAHHATVACHLLTAPPLRLRHPGSGSPYFLKTGYCRGPGVAALSCGLGKPDNSVRSENEFTYRFRFPNAMKAALPSVTEAT